MRVKKIETMLRKIPVWRSRSLTSRFTMALMLLVLSSLLIVGTGLIYIAAVANSNNTASLQDRYAERVSSMISGYVTSAADDLKLIDNLGILKTGDREQQLKILENLVIYKGFLFSQIAMADKDGNEKIKISRYHTYLSHEYKNLALSPAFRAALADGFFISPVYISDESGLLSIRIAARISSRNITGVIIAEINITKLWQDISEVKIGDTGYAYLVDKSGKYLASQHPSEVFRRHGINVSDIPPVYAFCSGVKYRGYKPYTGIEGNKVIGAYSPIPGTDWAVIVELPSSEAYKSFRYMMIYLISLLAAGTFTAGMAGYVSSKRIARHMTALAESAREMGKGNLDVEIPGQVDTDEVGVLARTLNLMRSELQGLYSDLQGHVSELTETRDALLKSESKYKALFENSGSALLMIEENNIISMVNRQFELMTGYTKAELEGRKTWIEFIADKNDLAKMQEYHANRLAGSRDIPGTYEFHLYAKNGFIINAIISVAMYPETKQSFVAIMDISMLKQVQNALNLSEQRFTAVFNNSYQFIALIDKDGEILEMNQTALDFAMTTCTDIKGKNILNIPLWSHSTDEQLKLKKGILTAAAGNPVRYETTNISGEGSIHDIDFSIKPVFDDNGVVVMLIAEGRDITDKKTAEANRIKLEEQLRQSQKMESIGRLAGGIAHDFNNVLGGIMGTVSVAKHKFEKGTINPDYLGNMIMVIENSAKRAAGIVNQILSLSRKQQSDFSIIDLNRSVHNVVELCRNSFDKGIIIIEKYDSEKSDVNADATQIEQVLLNICINAAHAMTIMRPEGDHSGGTLTIHVDSAANDPEILIPGHTASGAGYHRIRITDTGVGIDGKILPFIFDPFYSTKEKEKGTGLGLTMAYSIINEHNGFVTVKSEKGSGSEFTILLPAINEADSGDSRQDNNEIFYGTGNILIVDNEEVMRNVAAGILGECGYTPLTVDSGFTAIDIIRDNQPEIGIVLLDMAMPGINGKETFMELKKLQPGLKVVLTSGFKHDLRVIESIKSGVDGFIQKPYTIYNLSKTVHDVLHGNGPVPDTQKTI